MGLLALINADHFRLKHYARGPGLVATAANVADALRREPPTAPPSRYVSFDRKDITLAVEVVILLKRAGHPSMAIPEWATELGEDQCPVVPIQPGQAASGALPFIPWRIVPANSAPAGLEARPLAAGYALLTSFGTLDPLAGEEIRFGGTKGNDQAYTALGWATPEAAAAYRWSAARQAVLCFHAKPVPVGSVVRVVFDCVPFVLPGKWPVQHFGVNFGGTDLGTWEHTTAGTVEATIPAAVWNAREDAWLLLSFPDAVTPASLGLNTDIRRVAFAFSRIGFRVEPPAATAVSP